MINVRDKRRVSLESQSRRVLTSHWSLRTGKPRFQQSSGLAGPFGSSAHGSPLNRSCLDSPGGTKGVHDFTARPLTSCFAADAPWPIGSLILAVGVLKSAD